jgi:hypothetical protein
VESQYDLATWLLSSSLFHTTEVAPILLLKAGDLFLAMETHGEESKPMIRYVSVEPVKLKDSYLIDYQNSNISIQFLFLSSIFRAWCFRFALSAIQYSTGRSKLARMPRLKRVQLLVCLVSLLKVVSAGAKVVSAVLWGCLPSGHFSLSPSQYRLQGEMKRHLVQVIAYHVRQLIPLCFPESTALNGCVIRSADGLVADHSIFSTLNSEIENFLKTDHHRSIRSARSGGGPGLPINSTYRIIFIHTEDMNALDNPGLGSRVSF